MPLNLTKIYGIDKLCAIADKIIQGKKSMAKIAREEEVGVNMVFRLRRRLGLPNKTGPRDGT